MNPVSLIDRPMLSTAAAPRPRGDTRWLVTFTDLAALLVAFFVLLFSMAEVDSEKWQGTTSAFDRQFRMSDTTVTPRPVTMREQMRSIMRWAFNEKILQLSFMTIAGNKAAAYLCFDFQERVWVYNSGFDPQYREFSPGWVMLGYLIQHAIESGKKSFDFMRGDEDYKYRFGAAESHVLKIEISK